MTWRTGLSGVKTAMGILHGRRAFSGPFQADVNVTNRCNLRCVHCYYYSPHASRRNTRDLRLAPLQGACPQPRPLPNARSARDLEADPERIFSLIDDLVSLGTRHIQFTGNGELFTHESAMDFLARAKRARCYCIANTNCILIGPDRMRALVDMAFDDLRVTVMAGTPAMYVLTHPGAAESLFHDLTRNLTLLTELKNARSLRRPKLTLVLVVVSHNASGLLDFARFAASVGADAVRYKPFDDVRDPGLASVAPTADQEPLVKSRLDEAKAFLEERRIDHNVDRFLHAFRRQLNTEALYREIPCYSGWTMTRIDTDGLVYGCCRSYRPLGNVNDQSFREIWNSADYRRFRADALALKRRGSPVDGCDCGRCVHHMANARVFAALHPLKARSKRLTSLRP